MWFFDTLHLNGDLRDRRRVAHYAEGIFSSKL